MKMLLDMNLSPVLAKLLVENGVDAIHWFYVGAPNAQDTEIMAYARDNDCCVISSDLDFSAILSSTHDVKPSVIQVRLHGLQMERTAKFISLAVEQHEDDLKSGAIMTINMRNARVRLLPL